MPAKLLWTPKARADVKKIFVAISSEQPRSAERYFANFRRKAELLIEHPYLGERHPEVFRTARMLVKATMSSFTKQGLTPTTVPFIKLKLSE